MVSVTFPSPSERLTDLVIAYVEQNYMREISLRSVALALGYSSCHLTHTFRKSTGTPVTAWIIKRRIRAAAQLLADEDVAVATACEAVGFNDLCYFTRQFVRHVGTTPGRFRAAMHERAEDARHHLFAFAEERSRIPA